MPPGLTSPFTFEERKWIILKFGELKSATLVRRAFQKQFPKSSPRDVPNRKQFQRVLEQFNGSGDVGEAKPKHNVKDSVFFQTSIKSSILNRFSKFQNHKKLPKLKNNFYFR